MDVVVLYRGQQFIWDSEKAAQNTSKHGVAFESACQVFFDPLLRFEDASDGTELRDAAIGMSDDWTLLFVVHLLREADVVRIVSARLATAHERRLYEDGN